MQQKSSADKGFKIASLFSTFTMFPVMFNPLKFGWLIIPPALVMIYFASKKYKEDKQAGITESKYSMIRIMLCVSVFIMILITIANYLDEHGYFD